MTDFRAPIDQNKQTPEQKVETVVSPVVVPVAVTPAPVVDVTVTNPQVVVAPVQSTEMKEGPLDKFIKGLVHFIAKLSGQPDPITGEKTDPTISGNVAQRVWDTANKTIEKIGDVAQKTVEVTSNVTQKAVDITSAAVEKVGDVAQKTVEVTGSAVNAVKEIKQDISNTNQPATQSLESLEKPE